MTRGSHAVVTSPTPGRRPARAAAAAGGLALALALVLGAPAAGAGATDRPATQVGPTDPTTPGGGIGEPPGGGGGSTTSTTEASPTTERSTTTTTEADPTTTERQGAGEDGDEDDVDDAALARTDDDGGTSIVALAAVGLVGVIVGIVLAAVPLGAALSRRKRAPAPVPPPPAPTPPAPPAATTPAPAPAGPQIGTPPSRDEAQVRSQRAELAEALMALRDQVPSAALADEAARALAAVGITELRPDGEPFDASRHRAVDQVATPDPARHNTVVSTERPGYADGPRIVRLPEVVVARHDGMP